MRDPTKQIFRIEAARYFLHQTLALVRPNCPHKLTKTAEPWLGGGAAFGRLQLHARVTTAAVRSCHCVLVAAAAAPLS
jgi:hypothetical protein